MSNATAPVTEQEFDFGDHLPAGVESFALHWIAGRFGGTIQHWFNLARSGVFGKGIVDLRVPGSSKSMLRVPRAGLVKFLNSRRDIQAVEDASPSRPPQPASRKRRKRKKQSGSREARKGRRA